MSGVSKKKRRQGRPKGGIIFVIGKKIVEQFKEKEDFVQEELIGSRVKINGKEWKIVVVYMREKRREK